jgi:hypothetical protein
LAGLDLVGEPLHELSAVGAIWLYLLTNTTTPNKSRSIMRL